MFVEKYLEVLRRDGFTPRTVGVYVARCARMSWDAAHDRPRAVRGVVIAGMVHLVLLFLAAVGLSYLVDRELARAYFLGSSGWLAGGLVWITLHLGMFRHDRELPLTGLGLPNFLTLGRLLTIPAFYLFITRGEDVLALAAFAIGGLSDVADGIAARMLNAETRLGKLFDPLVDILFTAGVCAGLTAAGDLPVWLLVLVLIRYGTLTLGGTWIYVFRGPVRVQPTVLGKTTGLITSGLVLAVVLLRRFTDPEVAEQILELLYLVLGAIFLATTIQVLLLGISNVHRLKIERISGSQGSPSPFREGDPR